MDDTQTLELQLKSSGEETLKVLKDLIASINDIKTSLDKVKGSTAGIEDIGKASENTVKKVDKLSSSFNKLFTLIGVKKVATKAFDFLTTASNRAEELNLFNVIFKNIEKDGEKTFSELGKSAIRFQNRLNEAFGTNMTETLRYQGLFQAMATSAGIAEKDAYVISENMTKLAYDLASLYNKSEKTAAEALRAGVSAGQTKPLRQFGIDVTQTTLKPLLSELGINDRSINDMNQAEKQVLRYIATLRQAASAMGDFADTIESPANQLKIFKQQIVETKVAIGNLFMGMFANILPYANAILMVIKEIAKAIASLFGIKARDYNTGLASLEDTYVGVSDGAGKAAKATKELNRQLLKFDEVNNITTPKASGTGSGSGTGFGGVDSRILAGLKGYDNLMDSVRMKALDIRDSIMQWLGFTIQTNEETGEISFKFDHITFGTILTGLATGGSIYLGVRKIFNIFKSLLGLKTSGNGVLGLLEKLTGTKGKGTSTGSSFKLPDIKTVLKGVAELAIVTGGVTALIIAVGALNSIPGVEDIATRGIDLLKIVFKGIGSIALPLAGVSALTAILGSIGVAQVAKGFADLAIIIGGTTGLITAIGGVLSIPGFETALGIGIDSIKRAFNALAEVGVEIGVFSAGILLLGFATPATILSGMLGFAAIVGGLEAILLALGALNQIPGFTWLVGEGGKALVQIGTILGDFAGSIVSAFVDTATSSLPDVGTKLSLFMTNARPFFESINMVDEGTTRSVKNLASAILMLTASNVLDGLTSWFTGGSSFVKFGDELVEFAPKFKTYSQEMEGVNGDVVEKTSKAAKSIAEFAREIPNEGGMISWFAGDNTLRDFGKQLPEFGKNFKQYSDAVSGVKSDVVEASSKAALSVIEFSKQVPNQGGMVSWFTGDNKLGEFAKELPGFGKNFKSYADNIKGIDSSVVSKSSDAVKSIMEFANNVPNQGGIASWFSGDNKISDFGYQLKYFGMWFKDYYNYIASIGIDKVNSVSKAIGDLVKHLKEIKNNGLRDVLKDFGKSLSDSASDYKKFFENNLSYNQGNTIGTNFGNGIATGIKNKLKNYSFPTIKLTDSSTGAALASFKIKATKMGGIFDGTSWSNIPQYANGGMPSHGTLFAAGENGAEIVGNINRRTEVLNRSQIASSIYSAVVSAMSQFNGGTSQIDVHVHTDEGTVVDRINQKTKQTGRCPINIPSY